MIPSSRCLSNILRVNVLRPSLKDRIASLWSSCSMFQKLHAKCLCISCTVCWDGRESTITGQCCRERFPQPNVSCVTASPAVVFSLSLMVSVNQKLSTDSFGRVLSII